MAFALSCTAGSVCAQETAKGWPGLKVHRLPTVYVVETSGTETEGKLLRLAPDALVILVSGVERRFEVGSVQRIETRDSTRNGTIIGAVVGAVFGLLGAAVSDCPRSGQGSCAGVRAGLFLISTSFYAAAGMGIDAVIPGRTSLYEAGTPRPSANQERRSPNSPVLSLSLRW
jgi:hypothetical protein